MKCHKKWNEKYDFDFNKIKKLNLPILYTELTRTTSNKSYYMKIKLV